MNENAAMTSTISLPEALEQSGSGDIEVVRPSTPEEAGMWKEVHSAVRWGKFDDVKKLVKPANVDLQDPMNGNYTIHIAAQVSNEYATSFSSPWLLIHLQIGMQNGHLNIVSFLLEKAVSKKSTVNVQNKSGQTALHMAIEYDYFDIVQALKNAGADGTIKNKEGFQADYGIEGKKCLQLLSFSASTTTEELMKGLEALNKFLTTDDSGRLDKAQLVQTGMKFKKVILY